MGRSAILFRVATSHSAIRSSAPASAASTRPSGENAIELMPLPPGRTSRYRTLRADTSQSPME